MTAVMAGLGLLPNWSCWILVAGVGLKATLESVLGAVAQDRFSWLSNELVNALQTLLAAALAMVLAAVLHLA